MQINEPHHLNEIMRSTVRILLVDDDTSSISALTNLLEYNNTLKIAKNGREALDMFNKSLYDVVVTDIRMPKMNGLMLLKAIRGTNRPTRIIIVTGHANDKNESEARNNGVDAFFSKPLDVGLFMDTLSRFESEIDVSGDQCVHAVHGDTDNRKKPADE